MMHTAHQNTTPKRGVTETHAELRAQLIKLIKRWRHRALGKHRAAQHNGAELITSRRALEHAAMEVYNCAAELRDVVANLLPTPREEAGITMGVLKQYLRRLQDEQDRAVREGAYEYACHLRGAKVAMALVCDTIATARVVTRLPAAKGGAR